MNIYAFADEASPMMDGQIAALKRNGLQGLEIRHVDGENVADISEEKAVEVRKKLDAAGLIVWSVGSPIGKISIVKDDFAAHMEKFRHTLKIAGILGARNIRLFSFFIPQGKSPESYHDEVVRRLRCFVQAAEGTGVALCHENEKGIYGDVAARCLTLHREVPALQGVFDPANYIQCHQETLAGWELLHRHVKYLHIKDALADGTVVPAGCGEGRLPEILKAFLAQGGDHVTVEPHLTVFDGLNRLEREGDASGIGRFAYPSGDAAFDAACQALKTVLANVQAERNGQK